MTEDVCTKCGWEGPVEKFVNKRHVCKACKAEYDKERNKTYKRPRR